MQNIRAILVYLAIVGALLAAVVAVALLAWPWAVAAAMWPAENAVRAYEQMAAHGFVRWIQSGQAVDWYGWGAWWRHGPWPRVHQLTTHATHWRRVLAVTAVEGFLVASLLTLSPLRKLWPVLWFVMGRVGHLKPGRTHGTARWGGTWGLRPRPWWTPLYLGRRGRRWVALPWTQAVLGVLIVGLPGAGKSAALIIPNILRLGGNGLSRLLIRLGVILLPSIVVTDPKGEIRRLTAPWLRRLGYEVRVVDLLVDGTDTTDATDSYNPLAHCRDGHIEDIQRLADVWVANSGTERAGYSGDTAFWDLTLRELLVASIAHKNAAARARGEQAATLAAVFTFLRQDSTLISEELEDSVAAARVSYERFMRRLKEDPRLEASIFIGAGLRGQVFDIAAARAHTGHDALGDFRVLGRKARRPVALFATPTPGQEQTLRPLLASLFTQLLDALTDEANHNGSRRNALTRPVLAWLDEAGTIGKVAGLADAANRLRSAGVVLILSVQQVIQLRRTYGEDEARELAGACQARIVFSGVDHADAQWLSEAVGETTVVQEQRTASRKREHFWTDAGSISRSETRRSLIDPDELRRMATGRAIVEIANRHPFPIRTVEWWRVRGLLPFSRPLKRRAGIAVAGDGRAQEAPPAPAPAVLSTPRSYNGRVPFVRERPVHAVEYDFEVLS